MSIENEHRDIQRSFEYDTKDIEDIQCRISILKNDISNETNWLKKNRLELELDELKNSIDKLEKEKEQNDYYLSIARIIKTYKDNTINDSKTHTKNNFMDRIVNTQKGKQNKQLYQEFNNIVNNTIDQTYEISTNSYFCEVCKTNKVLIQTESNLVCEVCGNVEYYLDNTTNKLLTTRKYDKKKYKEFLKEKRI